MRRCVPPLAPAGLALAILALGLAAAPPAAALRIEALVTPLGGGGFHYDVSIVNDEALDVVLATILDAPLGDGTISATLVAPPGYLASYDPGFGFVDFVEDTSLFGAGSTVGGFAFDSASGPGPGVFESFQALTVNATFLVGTVDITLVPEATTSVLVALGLAATGALRPPPRRNRDA